MDFAISSDRRLKLKEGENIDKYLDLARELKKLWNMTVISIVVGAFGTISKGLEKETGKTGDQRNNQTIQTKTL